MAPRSALPSPCPLRLHQNWGRGGLLFLFLCSLALPAQARPKVLVVLADHLTLADVTRPDLPGFAAFTGRGQAALMSPGVAHGPDPVANVYATLGAGDSVGVGDVSQGRMDDALRAAGVRTALIGSADGDDTGFYRPALLLLPTPDVVFDPTVRAPTSPGGRRTDPGRLWIQTRIALRDADFVVVHFGDFARLERENQAGDLLPAAYFGHRERALNALDKYLGHVLTRTGADLSLMLVVPVPPLDAQGHWNSLTPLLLTSDSEGGRAGQTVTSDTTQTRGLVAARDVAPTVLAWLGVPVPLQMTGGAMRPSGASGVAVLPRLRAMDRQTRLNQEAQDPLFWGIGLIAPALIFPSLALFLTGRLVRGSRACGPVLYGVRLLAAWPLALLLAPLFRPLALSSYLGIIMFLSALIALLPSPALIFCLTAVVLISDGLMGTPLVSQSVLSSYALAGIRFYGIGNEYMGILIGGALLAVATTRWTRSGWRANPPPSSEEGDRGTRRGNAPGQLRGMLPGVLAWFALVTIVLSCPAFGAKAGGAVTATVVFTLAWLRLRGVRLQTRHALVGLALGFALVFLWGLLGDALHLRRTHLETAVGALEGGRLGYILGVSRRKVGLAARVFLHPGTLLGLLALVLLGLVARTVFWPHLTAYYARHSRLAAVSEAGLWGGLVCVLFNDSGIVAAILLLMCLILPALNDLFQRSCASLPLMSATSGSASPSATP